MTQTATTTTAPWETIRAAAPASVIRALREIPGVGASIAADLYLLGIHAVEELRGQDPEQLYTRFCQITGRNVDRCLLYVFRGAVYYASHSRHDPELLKWWNWKDAGAAPASTIKHGPTQPAQ
jgi:hypothetical protein